MKFLLKVDCTFDADSIDDALQFWSDHLTAIRLVGESDHHFVGEFRMGKIEDD